MKFVSCLHVTLQYEYAQVAVDLFCENIALVCCSVAVCIHISPYFLYPKECITILQFNFLIHSVMQLDKRHKAPQSHSLMYTLIDSSLDGS